MRGITKRRKIKWSIVLTCCILSLNIFTGCSKKDNTSKVQHNINEIYEDFIKRDISGLSEDEIINEIKKANEVEEILSQNKAYGPGILHYNYNGHDNLTEGFSVSYNNGKLCGSFVSGYVGNQDIFVFLSDEVYRYNSENKTFTRKIYFDNQYEDKKASLINCCKFLSAPYEKVKSIEKTDDNIIVHTEYDLSKENEDFKKSYGISDGVIKISYTVNPNTLIIKEKKADCLLPNGTRKELFLTSFFPLNLPEKSITTLTLDDLIPRKNRSFTVVFNPKTNNEKRETYQVKSGLNVTFDLPSGYYNAYRNEECTDIYHSSATRNDETIYLMNGK